MGYGCIGISISIFPLISLFLSLYVCEYVCHIDNILHMYVVIVLFIVFYSQYMTIVISCKCNKSLYCRIILSLSIVLLLYRIIMIYRIV